MYKYYQIINLMISRFCLTIALLLITQVAHAEYMDRVLVIVNEDIITQSEFDYRMVTVLADSQINANDAIPEGLSKQVLDSMIADRLQLQEAQLRGIEVSDPELEASLQRFAAQQNLSIEQLTNVIEKQGQSFKRFSESVRESLVISRLTDYYARTRVVVPDYEIKGFIAQNKLDSGGEEYQIAHILIKKPDQYLALAEKVLSEIQSGLSFHSAAIKYSEAADAVEGGVIGWRTLAQLPEVFSEAIKNTNIGEVTNVLQSPNGLHILKLLDLKGDREEILQSRVRHILIASKTKVAQAQASKKMYDLRNRVLDGEDFSQLARIYSDDSVSAATGGDLGWVSPGDMVRQFEQAYQQLAIGDISLPIASQYGIHLIEVLDRRQKNITDQVIRNKADNILRRQRADREFQQWIRELKEQAYIVHISDSA